MEAGSGAQKETYEETLAKLSQPELARHTLLMRGFGSVLHDERTEPIVNSDETGELTIMFVESAFDLGLPWLKVDFGGTINYRVKVHEGPLGPAHSPGAIRVVEAERI